ncbi:MAG: mechanosensitive ion channel family protein [Terracidiphilus sp.]|jgi:small conductance mechanosensitive channel
MSLFSPTAEFLLILRWGWFQEGRFLGRVLDEWINDSQEFIHAKLPRLIVIAIIAFVLNRLLRLATSRMIHVSEKSGAGLGRRAEVRTMAGVIRATGLAIIGVIAMLQALDSMGFNLAPLLASAGVAGIAIGLAAQNIVKDMFNGMLFLVEDQFNVGDTVRLAGLAGTVESMTLRKTTVRDADGTLYVIPNSQITTVANLSADFSVATVNVSVDFSAHPDEVTRMLKQIAMDVRNSDEFKNVILQDPQVLGVDAVKGSQVIFPVVFKTIATQQYGPVREFQRRVRLALEEKHMLPGDPYRVFRPAEESAAAGLETAAKEPAPAQDPTTLRQHDDNPFSGN